MKILIMADMEGVSGIVTWDQVTGGAPMYEEG
ncbi:MAG: M55 family metallopeptidase, partial [Chloroflexi bacterium]|nr:M55 family metallopeptidase [Chloroflexota bacterium]